MKKRFLALLLLCCSLGVVAQDNMTQQAVGLVQSINVNPAMRPSRGFISIPIIGSMQFGVSNSFSYADAISVKSGGTKYLDFSRLVNTAMTNGNSLMINTNLDLVNVGFYVSPDDFLNISIRGRLHAATSWPLGMMEFISDNSVKQSREYNINMMPSIMGWAEIGVGYSRSIGNFTVGARFKYLEGIGGVSSENGVNFNVDKQYDKYYLSSDYSLNMGGVALGKDNEMAFKYMPFKNPGFAVDLGASWVSEDERIAASVSVSDLGRIWWDQNATTQFKIKNPNQKFEYDGLGNLLQQGLDFGQLLDSVKNDFINTVGMDTLKGAGFSTALPTTFQAMGSYSLGRRLQHNLSLGFIGQLQYRGGFDYAISAGYAYRSPNKVWQFMANYSFRSNNPINLGLGAVMTVGCFQLYLATDNVISFFNGPQARNANFRLGLNFFFGPESVRN